MPAPAKIFREGRHLFVSSACRYLGVPNLQRAIEEIPAGAAGQQIIREGAQRACAAGTQASYPDDGRLAISLLRQSLTEGPHLL
jgi:hypothetical protein